jgi:hypothetical protein
MSIPFDEEDIGYDDQDWYGDKMYPYEDCGGGIDEEGEE